jgi:farnesyl-diphosphate farnesyltransferase
VNKLDSLRQDILDGDPAAGPAFARQWLKRVSRTFALNIRVLPAPLENAVRLAYLFCRIADTVEDDRVLPASERISLLEQFQACFQADGPDMAAVHTFRDSLPAHWEDSTEDDQFLSWHCEPVFAQYAKLDAGARSPIDSRVIEMCVGMAKYAALRGEDGWFTLDSVEDLRDYCYFVAGLVGLLLCDLFAWHEPSISGKRLERLRSKAVGFGLALQYVNIARDIPADHSRQTVFVPDELWRRHGLDARNCTNPDAREAATQALAELLQLAQIEVEAAHAYILDLPRRAYRIRLFCLWPLLMAQDTLVKLGENLPDVLDPTKRIKIGRKAVTHIMRTTLLCASSNTLIGGMFRRRNERLRAALERP